jgi:hypothetical protein
LVTEELLADAAAVAATPVTAVLTKVSATDSAMRSLGS